MRLNERNLLFREARKSYKNDRHPVNAQTAHLDVRLWEGRIDSQRLLSSRKDLFIRRVKEVQWVQCFMQCPITGIMSTINTSTDDYQPTSSTSVTVALCPEFLSCCDTVRQRFSVNQSHPGNARYIEFDGMSHGFTVSDKFCEGLIPAMLTWMKDQMKNVTP